MIILQPSRTTFWRTVFAVTSLLPLLSIWQTLDYAPGIGVDLSASRSWMGLIIGLGSISLLSLLFLTSTWSRYQERILSLAESPERLPRWISGLLLAISLIGFTIAPRFPLLSLLSGIGWIRVLIFWLFSLLGMLALRSLRREIPQLNALIAFALCQSVLHILLLQWQRVTTYPFAMGWSETSRFYYPSLFLSEHIYGAKYPWPILHPTLHLLLTPPYLFNAPLWFHRFWKVALSYGLIAAVVPALMKRIFIPNRATRWLVAIWMFLFLYMGPVYFHLTLPIIIVLLGFSSQNNQRTWFAVLLASIWCGWSRVNWYPMPGSIAAVLYLMEMPFKGKNLWSYLAKPAAWFIAGTLTAFASQRIYIALSGVPHEYFYTSLTSDLLWYRLMPNASYSLGILPAALLASLPAWIAMYSVIRSRRADWHPLRLVLIFSALFVLFLGGLVVSLKIGGGANIHNMDAYLSLLLIVFVYLVLARYRDEDGKIPLPVPMHWLLAASLIIMPAWSYLKFDVGVPIYDVARTQNVLASLQDEVDQVNARGGEILFITQRHLVSMGMLRGVTLVPEYEREDLMEMAMANNLQYLGKFQKAMEDQRFALIVVDPLNFTIMTRNRSFGEENNVWVTRVMRYILCYYREETLFPEDDIALYVPREEGRQCP